MDEKLKLWDERAANLSKSHPLKNLTHLPKMVGIVPKTARFLQAKGLFYLIKHDKNKLFLRYFFKRPALYTWKLLRSYLSPKKFHREGDLFFYGIQTQEEFTQAMQNDQALLLVGFSYCHKPLECPSGRFTPDCQNAPNHPVCNQCFIGKCSFLLQGTKAQVVYIPTIHYIGEKIFELVDKNPKRPVFFLITACELSLTMFADWGNMIQAKGIGIRLDGRICNTMQAFHLSERGVKPGLTVVLDQTQQQMLELIRSLHRGVCDEKAWAYPLSRRDALLESKNTLDCNNRKIPPHR